MASEFVASDQMNAVLTEWKIRLKTDLGNKIMSPIFHILYLMCLSGFQIDMSSKELCTHTHKGPGVNILSGNTDNWESSINEQLKKSCQ